MRTVLPVADRLTRTHWRGLLLRLLGKDALVRRLVVGAEGGIVVQTQDWDRYWEPLLELGLPAVTDKLQALLEVRRSYVASQLSRELRREYCFRYFTLLDSLLHECRAHMCAGALRKALRRVLGFECFGIAAAGAEDEVVAAATTTLRNPCYLLAKLKAPDAPEDCKFLPLVAVGGDGSARLFYHYRQHKLAIDSENSLLLYLAASQADRQRSFHVINALERQIDQGKDPRANERAKRLADGIMLPYIRGVLSDEAVPGGGRVLLGLIDLGSGSGVLAARVCDRLGRTLAGLGTDVTFRVWLVDLSLCEPSRFFGAKQLRTNTDCIMAMGADYQQWLAAEDRFPRNGRLRLALASRFFNNLSDFQTVAVAPESALCAGGAERARADWQECFPANCLCPGGRGTEALEVSSAHVWLDGGRTFAQASLSPYFEGLHMLSGDRRKQPRGAPDRLFLPLRRFRPDRLLTRDGDSVLERLLDDCSLVVVQDADMRPQDLVAHREFMRSPGIVAIDTTKELGLKGHFSYALGRADDQSLAALAGERLW